MEPTNQGEAPQGVAKLSWVIQIDEEKIQAQLGEVVRSTVEETLNAMLETEADRLCRAERCERTEAREDTRAGSYQRQLHTKVGEVSLKVPKLRTLPFETAIIEERGLKGVRLFVSDKCLCLVESLGESYPEAMWQRCAVHFYRNV